MGKRLLCIVCAAAFLACLPSALSARPEAARPASDTLSSADSLIFAKLDAYLHEVDRLPLAEACAESDFIISSVPDSLTRNKVASRVYRHWRKSPVMGAENVAVYVYDTWFASFKTVFADMNELDEAEFYAFVNRRSLLGAKAAELIFSSAKRDSVTLPASSAGRRVRSIIYFYSSDCPKCLYTSVKLSEYLNSSKKRVNLYTVYTLEDRERWSSYVKKELSVKSTCRTKVYHLFGGDVDYVVPYGVVQTPRLFLVDENGVIVGRNLDVQALARLLDMQ